MKRLRPGARVRISRLVLLVGGRVATVARTRNHLERGRVAVHVPIGRNEFFAGRPTCLHIAREMLKEIK